MSPFQRHSTPCVLNQESPYGISNHCVACMVSPQEILLMSLSVRKDPKYKTNIAMTDKDQIL